MVTNIVASMFNRFTGRTLVAASTVSEGGEAPPSPEPVLAAPEPPLPPPAVTALKLAKIQAEFAKVNKGLSIETCNIYIGCESVDPELRKSIRKAGNTFLGTPVSYISGAVGVLMLMPNYKSTLLKQAKAAPKKVKVKSTKPKQVQTKKDEKQDAN